MTTYNTGNPLGSSAAKDLYDNAQNLDFAVNSITQAIWSDRFGRSRKTWFGIEKNALEAIAAFGYITIDSFEEGATLTLPNQVLRWKSNGEYYRWDGEYNESGKIVPEASTPESSGGIGIGAWLSVGDATLRSNLKSAENGNGDELITIKQPITGSLARTQHSKNYDLITLEDFGAVGDGIYHPLSEMFSTLSIAQVVYPFVTSLVDSIDWAAAQAAAQSKRKVLIRPKSYVITKSLTFSNGTEFEGESIGRWIPGYTSQFPPSLNDGVNFLFYGTGDKNCSIKGVSRNDVSGGSIINPSASDPYTATAPSPRYDLLDFTNRNASGITPATSKSFSAAVILPKEGGVSIKKCRFVPWFNGLEGYKSEAELGMGDAWDVGLWEHNSALNRMEDVQFVGYWRMAAHLKTLISDNISPANGESSQYLRCIFQGYRGASIRALDQFRVTAVGSNSIEIPWSAGHQFANSGVLRTSGINFSYTGISFSGDKLTFTGISSTVGAVVGNSIRTFTSDTWGMAGTQYIDCWITGLYHASRLLSTSTYLGSVFETHSTPIEWSGEPARGLQFLGCTLQSFDDILIMTVDAGDPIFLGTYMESQSARSTPGGSVNAIAVGGRLIAHSSSLSSAQYPAGSTRNFRLIGCTYGPGVDKGPLQPFTGGRFVTGVGCFKPRESYDDGEAFPSFVNGEVRLVSAGAAGIQPAIGYKTVIGPTSGNAEIQARVNALMLESSLRIFLGAPTLNWYQADADKFMPAADNTRALGQASNRWTTVYAATGSINTSDARYKSDPVEMEDAERLTAQEIKGMLKKFKFTESINEKGESDARWHFGVLAQDVEKIFKNHGLNPNNYGLFCYDYQEGKEATYDKDGVEITPAIEKVDRYGIRYEELLCFILASI